VLKARSGEGLSLQNDVSSEILLSLFNVMNPLLPLGEGWDEGNNNSIYKKGFEHVETHSYFF